MSLPLVFRRTAQLEFDEAALWYEARRIGLGAEFAAEIQKVLDTIAEYPDRYPIVFGDVREARARRFPYCVYYRRKLDRVVVIAVFHTSREPSIWQARA
jgi:plasmid stabilization system protein ParE